MYLPAIDFRPYESGFCRLLGIESEMALRLLHKTQSAKNLGEPEHLLRDFVLDRPDTFDVATAWSMSSRSSMRRHQSVVTAREQVQMLVPARNDYKGLRNCGIGETTWRSCAWALMRSGKRAVRQCSRNT